ncbi:MAG: hypothetical protein NT120_01955 [Candidatus Aenigmarchaeota archaeon]|nr:hypothetical protein [Candidatus Aenigmarchaeota archaeon]
MTIPRNIKYYAGMNVTLFEDADGDRYRIEGKLRQNEDLESARKRAMSLTHVSYNHPTEELNDAYKQAIKTGSGLTHTGKDNGAPSEQAHEIIKGKYFTGMDVSICQDEAGNVYVMKGRVTGHSVDEMFGSATLVYKADDFQVHESRIKKMELKHAAEKNGLEENYQRREQELRGSANREKTTLREDFEKKEHRLTSTIDDLKRELDIANSSTSLDEVMRRLLSRESEKNNQYWSVLSEHMAKIDGEIRDIKSSRDSETMQHLKKLENKMNGVRDEIRGVKSSKDSEVMQYMKRLESEIGGMRDLINDEILHREIEHIQRRRIRDEEEFSPHDTERPEERQPEKKPVCIASGKLTVNGTTYNYSDDVAVYDEGDVYRIVKNGYPRWETRMPKLTTQVTQEH